MINGQYFDFTKQTSLYIHVPFCLSKCLYCAFFSKAGQDVQLMEMYGNRIVDEINNIVSLMNNKPFYTAFIGGGNPGCLPVTVLEKIAKAVCLNGRPLEFTVEMNPESLCYEHFPLFEQYFTRLSMGVQSLSRKALKFIGRNSDLETTEKGLGLSQKLKIKTGCLLSYDLITCLGSWHDTFKDIDIIEREYSSDHLSMYSLTLEEGTPLYKKRPILPKVDQQAEELNNLWDKLEKLGFKQYEVSNFAKNGKISLHNSVYWNYRQYVGLGPAAASTGFIGKKAYRIDGTHDVANWKYSVQELSMEEQLEEFVLMGLRHTAGLDLKRLKSDFGKHLHKVPSGYFVENDFLVPHKEGLLTADNAALYFITECLH